MTSSAASTTGTFISPSALLEHWQGHRRLTRRMIETFPEDQLFSFSIGGMRPFGELVGEMLGMAAPMLRGLVTGEWGTFTVPAPKTKAELLREWDESTRAINEYWPRLSADRFAETVTSFGQFTGPMYWQILYLIDNEVHHRGQGYVYLRALGVTPPAFYERD
jgi:uncharacterized damage-inducible protein DinB